MLRLIPRRRAASDIFPPADLTAWTIIESDKTRRFSDQPCNEGGEIAALAQGGQHQRQAIDPVVEVGAESAGFHFGLQVSMRRANQREVHRNRLAAAERRYLPLLQYAQQACLHRQRHVTDFIEEQCAAVGLADATGRSLAAGAGKRAGDIAEEFGLDQGFRQGGAIHRDEWLVLARPRFVHGADEQFLADARFAEQQQRDRLAQHFARPLDGGPHARIAGVEHGELVSNRVVARRRRHDGQRASYRFDAHE